MIDKKFEEIKLITEYPIPKQIKEHLRKFNIAILGDAGVGKSSIVNALRSLKNSDKDACKTSSSSQTTFHPKAQILPSSYLKDSVWDMPGVGTSEFPLCNQFKDTGLRYMDVVILVQNMRVSINQISLKNLMQQPQHNVPILFVRNKIDIIINDQQRDLQYSQKQAIEECKLNAKKDGIDLDKYQSICSQEHNLHDFPKFLKEIAHIQKEKIVKDLDIMSLIENENTNISKL